MIKVRIDKASNKDYWYNSQIGAEFFVEIENEKQYVVFVYENQFGGGNYIVKSDCTVISDDTDQKEDEFVLPEKWCVSHCKESLAWIQKNAEIGGHRISKSNWYMFPNNKNMSNFSKPFPEGYTKITQDQFFAHVWEKELKKEEPIFGGKNGLLDHFKVEPVPVVQETTGPIPFDLEKYNTGKYDVVNKLNEPVRILATDADMDQPIIGIHEGATEKWSIDGSYYLIAGSVMDLFLVAKTETTDNYVSSVEEEHEEKINNTEVACAIAGFNIKRKDLDMFVSMYDLVIEYGGKLDLDTITETQVKVNRRHDSAV